MTSHKLYSKTPEDRSIPIAAQKPPQRGRPPYYAYVNENWTIFAQMLAGRGRRFMQRFSPCQGKAGSAQILDKISVAVQKETDWNNSFACAAIKQNRFFFPRDCGGGKKMKILEKERIP